MAESKEKRIGLIGLIGLGRTGNLPSGIRQKTVQGSMVKELANDSKGNSVAGITGQPIRFANRIHAASIAEQHPNNMKRIRKRNG